MDLLFKEYASPFLLLDGIIQTGRLCEFLETFQVQYRERELWKMYLHKNTFDERTWEDFKEGGELIEEVEIPSDEQLETTVRESWEILDGFKI